MCKKNDEYIKKLTKQYENELLNNPDYSSSWINQAAKIMAEFDKDEAFLKPFNTEQLDVIYDALKYINNNGSGYIDINDIANPAFNATQMSLVLTGYIRDIPIEILAKFISPNIPYAKSNYLVQAYIDGFNMTDYINYDHEQIYEIYAGFMNKVDFKLYDKSYISAKIMGLIRHALEIGAESISYNNKELQFKV